MFFSLISEYLTLNLKLNNTFNKLVKNENLTPSVQFKCSQTCIKVTFNTFYVIICTKCTCDRQQPSVFDIYDDLFFRQLCGGP